MADGKQRDAQAASEAGREQGTRGGQAAQRIPVAIRTEGEAAGAAMAEEGHAAAGAQRRAGEAMAGLTASAGAGMAQQMRRGARDLAESERRFASDTAAEMEEVADRYAEAIRAMTHDMTRLMMMPSHAGGGGMREMQAAMGNLFDGVVRSNLRMTRELFRHAGPGPLVNLQGAFLRECMDAMMESGGTMLRAARRSAEEALRPLERRQEQRAARGRPDGEAGHGPRVADVMTRNVRVIGPEETVQQAARTMEEQDAGILPIGENDRLVGMVTDRDLAIRVLANGKEPARTRVREIMTPGIHFVFEDQDVDSAAETMRQKRVRRLPVLNRAKRLVGIVSLGDLALRGGERDSITHALSGIARHGGPHDQTLEARGG